MNRVSIVDLLHGTSVVDGKELEQVEDVIVLLPDADALVRKPLVANQLVDEVPLMLNSTVDNLNREGRDSVLAAEVLKPSGQLLNLLVSDFWVFVSDASFFDVPTDDSAPPILEPTVPPGDPLLDEHEPHLNKIRVSAEKIDPEVSENEVKDSDPIGDTLVLVLKGRSECQ